MSAALQFRDDYAARRDRLRERIGELPGPRVWTGEQLAEFLGIAPSSVYAYTRRDSINPVPRCAVKLVRFDTQNVEFLLWLARWLGIDVSDMEG